MSWDIAFLSLVDDVTVISKTEVDGSEPRAIRLVCGGDVRYTASIEINGLKTQSFSIISDRALLVFPDSGFDDTSAAQMAISVISSRWTSQQKVRLVFSPTAALRKVTGTQKLIQQLVKYLLSNVGSNRFDTGEGGDVLRSVGLTIDESAKAQIASVFAEAAARAEQQFVQDQTTQRLPADERLLSFKFNQVTFDSDSQQVVVALRLITYAGQSVSVPLVI